VLAAGDDSGVTSLWDARTGRLLARLGTAQLVAAGEVDYTGIDTLALSPDGSLLATVTSAGGVTLWRTATGKEAGSTLVPSAIGAGGAWAGGTDAIAFSDGDDYRLTIAVGRRGVYRWDAGTGRLRTVVTWPACQSCGYPIALSADGNYALVGGATAQLWDLSYSGVAQAWADPVGYPIASVALSPDGPVAFGDDDGGPDTDVTFPAAAYLRY
jgi:WD40 repeat protein